MTERSKLVKMEIRNLGCFSETGVTVDLSNIVCLVGSNNTGKSTVLRAYEAAVTKTALKPEEFNCKSKDKPASVEMWIHIPKGANNIDEKWKETKDGMLLVRSKWEWPAGGGTPVRSTWDPAQGAYAEDGKAAGLDEVFNSRLPKPFRIGSLENPEEEHKNLLSIVLEPIAGRLKALMENKDSDLKRRISDLQLEAEKPVAEFQQDLEKVAKQVNESYQRVFNASEINFSVRMGDILFDPARNLLAASSVEIKEGHGQTRWELQGTGSQRALFWSMLKVRSELNRILEEKKLKEKEIKEKDKDLKKLKDKQQEQNKPDSKAKPETKKKTTDEIAKLEGELAALRLAGAAAAPETFLPGHMLLIDEPETALHPEAVRAAKEHLYSLSEEPGWQVMLSTHHPSFIDPLKKHTTIVRLHRPSAAAPPNLYRSDGIDFSKDERECLKNLLAFDNTVAEMFFGSRVILVEGDTEFASFTEVMDQNPLQFPIGARPLIIRARGKATIPLLMRMLAHFKVDFAVLHDVDSPKTSKGKANSAYASNSNIMLQAQISRKTGIKITHRFSCPNFELHHGLELSQKEKPFEAWQAVRKDEKIRESVLNVLKSLCAPVTGDGSESPEDGAHFENKLKEWTKKYKVKDAEFAFD